jgi:YD repeat-containing protein
MKKNIALLLVASTFLISCSKTDEPVTVATILPKTVKDFGGLEYSNTITFQYDGSKIASISSIKTDKDNKTTTSKTIYTYIGNQIAKQRYYDNNNVETQSVTYTYNNDGKLIKEARIDGDYTITTDYTHNGDGTVSYATTKVNNLNSSKSTFTGVYTYANGNLIKHESLATTYKTLTQFEYDTKNNPVKNITGFLQPGLEELSSINNIVKKTVTSPISTRTYTYTYEYNAANYPTKEINKEGNRTTEFTY